MIRTLQGGASLAGLSAVITGGSSGIGQATAAAMVAAGARVGVLDRHTPTVEVDAHAIADVADSGAVTRAVASMAEQLGGLHILINNAAIGAQGGVESNDDAEWTNVLDINVIGVVRTTRAALPYLRAAPTAAIVNVGSVAASVGLPDRALYAASKGAVESLTRAMAADLLPEAIRVNSVSPGTVDTPWVGRLLAAAADPVAERAKLVARQPHGRLVTAEEVAAAICFLASPASGSITGTTIAVDGGMAGLRRPPSR